MRTDQKSFLETELGRMDWRHWTEVPAVETGWDIGDDVPDAELQALHSQDDDHHQELDQNEHDKLKGSEWQKKSVADVIVDTSKNKMTRSHTKFLEMPVMGGGSTEQGQELRKMASMSELSHNQGQLEHVFAYMTEERLSSAHGLGNLNLEQSDGVGAETIRALLQSRSTDKRQRYLRQFWSDAGGPDQLLNYDFEKPERQRGKKVPHGLEEAALTVSVRLARKIEPKMWQFAHGKEETKMRTGPYESPKDVIQWARSQAQIYNKEQPSHANHATTKKTKKRKRTPEEQRKIDLKKMWDDIHRKADALLEKKEKAFQKQLKKKKKRNKLMMEEIAKRNLEREQKRLAKQQQQQKQLISALETETSTMHKEQNIGAKKNKSKNKQPLSPVSSGRKSPSQSWNKPDPIVAIPTVETAVVEKSLETAIESDTFQPIQEQQQQQHHHQSEVPGPPPPRQSNVPPPPELGRNDSQLVPGPPPKKERQDSKFVPGPPSKKDSKLFVPGPPPKTDHQDSILVPGPPSKKDSKLFVPGPPPKTDHQDSILVPGPPTKIEQTPKPEENIESPVETPPPFTNPTSIGEEAEQAGSNKTNDEQQKPDEDSVKEKQDSDTDTKPEKHFVDPKAADLSKQIAKAGNEGDPPLNKIPGPPPNRESIIPGRPPNRESIIPGPPPNRATFIPGPPSPKPIGKPRKDAVSGENDESTSPVVHEELCIPQLERNDDQEKEVKNKPVSGDAEIRTTKKEESAQEEVLEEKMDESSVETRAQVEKLTSDDQTLEDLEDTPFATEETPSSQQQSVEDAESQEAPTSKPDLVPQTDPIQQPESQEIRLDLEVTEPIQEKPKQLDITEEGKQTKEEDPKDPKPIEAKEPETSKSIQDYESKDTPTEGSGPSHKHGSAPEETHFLKQETEEESEPPLEEATQEEKEVLRQDTNQQIQVLEQGTEQDIQVLEQNIEQKTELSEQDTEQEIQVSEQEAKVSEQDTEQETQVSEQEAKVSEQEAKVSEQGTEQGIQVLEQNIEQKTELSEQDTEQEIQVSGQGTEQEIQPLDEPTEEGESLDHIVEEIQPLDNRIEEETQPAEDDTKDVKPLDQVTEEKEVQRVEHQVEKEIQPFDQGTEENKIQPLDLTEEEIPSLEHEVEKETQPAQEGTEEVQVLGQGGECAIEENLPLGQPMKEELQPLEQKTGDVGVSRQAREEETQEADEKTEQVQALDEATEEEDQVVEQETVEPLEVETDISQPLEQETEEGCVEEETEVTQLWEHQVPSNHPVLEKEEVGLVAYHREIDSAKSSQDEKERPPETVSMEKHLEENEVSDMFAAEPDNMETSLNGAFSQEETSVQENDLEKMNDVVQPEPNYQENLDIDEEQVTELPVIQETESAKPGSGTGRPFSRNTASPPRSQRSTTRSPGSTGPSLNSRGGPRPSSMRPRPSFRPSMAIEPRGRNASIRPSMLRASMMKPKAGDAQVGQEELLAADDMQNQEQEEWVWDEQAYAAYAEMKWVELYDETYGQMYYEHLETGESSWEPPAEGYMPYDYAYYYYYGGANYDEEAHVGFYDKNGEYLYYETAEGGERVEETHEETHSKAVAAAYSI